MGYAQCERSILFGSAPVDVTLALLRANDQISAEAASTFYGKRIFEINPHHLVPFLEDTTLRRYLIKDIDILETPTFELRFPPQTFALLRDLNELRSFTIKIETTALKEVQTHIVEVGIYKFTDRIDVTVHSEHTITQSFEYVVFTNACEGWERMDMSGLSLWRSHSNTSLHGQRSCLMGRSKKPACNHSLHRLGWHLATEGSSKIAT